MKAIIALMLFLICGCAKAPSVSPSANIFTAFSYFLGSNEFPCQGCVTLETQNMTDLRVLFTETDTEEECVNKGVRFYAATETLVFPTDTDTVKNWTLQGYGSDAGEPVCFPEVLQIQLQYVSPNVFLLDYNSKVYRIRKL